MNELYLVGSSAETIRPTLRTFVSSLNILGIPTRAPWLNWATESHPDEALNWLACQSEVQDCRGILVYAMDAGLRGALVEVGMALGLGKPVFMYTPTYTADRFGTWVNHPLIRSYHDQSKLISDLRGLF